MYWVLPTFIYTLRCYGCGLCAKLLRSRRDTVDFKN